jgi:polyisoprenoid-binding protein YceI
VDAADAADPVRDDGVAQQGPAPAGAINYVVVPGKSTLAILVYKDPDTIGAGASHDHIIVAQGWSGFVTWSQGDNSGCKVTFDVPVKGLSADQPAMRKKYGLSSILSDGQRSDVKKNMLSKNQLDAGSHPKIKFAARSCSGSQGQVTVKGMLTIHGVTKPVSIPMKVTASDAAFTGKGRVTIRATDFGFDPYSAGFGALKNKNNMVLIVDVTAQPK